MLQAFLLALAFALAAASIQEVAAIPAQAFLQAPVPMLPPKVVQPDLCQDGTKVSLLSLLPHCFMLTHLDTPAILRLPTQFTSVLLVL